MKRFFPLVVFALAINATAQNNSGLGGSICGTVTNERGVPARSVIVTAMNMSGGHSGGFPAVRTEPDGRYCFARLEAGEYTLSADDPGKGYPNLSILFYGAGFDLPRVMITAEERSARRNWRIPYRAATFVLDIVNSATQTAIEDVTIHVYIRGNEKMRYLRTSLSTSSPILIPPDTDIFYKVMKSGYDRWPGDGSEGAFVNAGDSEVKMVRIQLRPVQ